MEFLLPICGEFFFGRNLKHLNSNGPMGGEGKKSASFKELGGGPNKFGTITQTGTDGGGDALGFVKAQLDHQIPYFWVEPFTFFS